MVVSFYLSDEIREQEFIRTGRRFSYKVTLEVPTEEISPEARKELVRMQSYFKFYPPGVGRWWENEVITIGCSYPCNLKFGWMPPFVPQNGEEWDEFLLGYARFRQEKLIPELSTYIEELRDPENNFPTN